LDPILRRVRGKLVRAVQEGIVGGLEELRRDIADFEHRTRRDLAFAADRIAVMSSAEFVQLTMPTAPAFPSILDTLRHALSLAPADGMALEFGVWSGTTLSVIAQARDGEVYGFDSFQGLPEDWRTGFPAGIFESHGLPDVPGAELVVGMFADTLPAFLDKHDGPVSFLHVDSDLYSSARTVLEHVGPRLRPGSIVVFDEFFNYPGWQQHEYKAWREFVDATGIGFRCRGYTADNEQVIIEITAIPAG
jgi:predicted O-methyltransferase YrrM